MINAQTPLDPGDPAQCLGPKAIGPTIYTTQFTVQIPAPGTGMTANVPIQLQLEGETLAAAIADIPNAQELAKKTAPEVLKKHIEEQEAARRRALFVAGGSLPHPQQIKGLRGNGR